MTSTVIYEGALRTKSKHLKSGEEITTDAPTDNNGKGEAFSPTDMVANSLATCALTIMGIVADRKDISIENSSAEVTKVMASNPRRIAEITILFKMKAKTENSDKELLEKAALTCPVFQSLHPDIIKDIRFEWFD